MRPDEPLTPIFLGQGALNILQVVVCGQVQGVAAGHIVVDQGVVLNDAEFLSWIELGSGLISEVLLIG